MSTQPYSSNDELDRTDELPQLDVEVYEASLAEKRKSLSRTDTWTVEALRDADELSESGQRDARIAAHGAAANDAGKLTHDAEALTVNVERILKRIAEVESDVAAAHEANAALQKRSEAMQADRDQQAQRIRALEAENARLGEHRSLADEMVQRLERQLREQSQNADAQLKELQSTRSAERLHAEKSLSDERVSTAQLARQLASKLKDCEMLGSLVDLRNRSIDDLTHVRDDLNARLQRETASGVALKSQLVVAQQGLHENHTILLERDQAIAEKDTRLAELIANLDRTGDKLELSQQQYAALEARLEEAQQTIAASDGEREAAQAQIRSLTEERDAVEAQVRALTKERDALLPASAELAEVTAELEQRGTELAQLHQELVAARAGAHSGAHLLNERTEELARLRAKFSEHGTAIRALEQTIRARDEVAEGLMAQLQTERDERAILSGQLEKARNRVKSLTQQIFGRDNQIAELNADLAVHTEALAAIRRDVNRIGGADDAASEDVERVLEPIEHNGDPIVLAGKAFTLGRTTENDICIPSKLVSRHHARLLVGPNGVIVEDAGSTNGCFVNGEEVRQHLMRDGDVLELGDLRYRLCVRSTRDTRNRAANVVAMFENRRSED